MYRRNIDFWIDRSRQEKAVAVAGSMVGAGAGVGVCYYLSPEPPKTVKALDHVVEAFNSASGGMLEPAAEQSRGESQVVSQPTHGDTQQSLPLPAELGIIGAGALLGAAAYALYAARVNYRPHRAALNKELQRIQESSTPDSQQPKG